MKKLSERAYVLLQIVVLVFLATDKQLIINLMILSMLFIIWCTLEDKKT